VRWGDIVLSWTPTFFDNLGLFAEYGLRGLRVRWKPTARPRASGILADGLRRSWEFAPRETALPLQLFSEPTGATTSAAKKRAILDLLRQYNARRASDLSV
jgi:DNA-binding transcriptional MocR family regulator